MKETVNVLLSLIKKYREMRRPANSRRKSIGTSTDKFPPRLQELCSYEYAVYRDA